MLGILLAAQAPSADDDAPPPSKALLEFVASFQSVDGEWLDPMSLPEQSGSDQAKDEQDDEQAKDKSADRRDHRDDDVDQRRPGR